MSVLGVQNIIQVHHGNQWAPMKYQLTGHLDYQTLLILPKHTHSGRQIMYMLHIYTKHTLLETLPDLVISKTNNGVRMQIV